MAEPSSIFTLLASLPFSHPSFLPLVESHKPFSRPSYLSQNQLTKLFNRLNTLLLSRGEDAERRHAFELAESMVRQDDQGWIMINYGKGWVGSCLAHITSPSTSVSSIPPPLGLLRAIVLSSAQYPAFERETIHPVMGKLSVSLGKLLERSLADEQREWSVILLTLETIRALLLHSPANFRPLVPTVKPILYTLMLQIPTPPSYNPSVPEEVRHSAANLLASLHVTAGKAQSPSAWGGEMRDVLGGLGRSITSITSDAWEEEPVRVAPPPGPASLPDLPADPLTRLPVALDWLEGHVEALLALLRFSTSRPVPVPIAQIISVGLRCLSLTLDTPTVSYISPQHHAALLACLPRFWTAGVQLIGAVALACGDHLFPHLGTILDHTVWLAERLPAGMTESQTQFLRFHHLLFALYPPALVPVDYPARLLRLCLTRYSPLLDSRVSAGDASGPVNGSEGGKRGKKRARGAEDGLVGGLEGREGRSLGADDCSVIIQALKLAPILHSTPLLAPGLLTFSTRLHLSLHLSLQSASSSSFSTPSSLNELKNATSHVLEEAALMAEGENGTARGWKGLIYAVLSQNRERLAPVLHPSLPPLMRPLPPLSALHFFGPEGEDEKRKRKEMGFRSVDELNKSGADEDDEMESGGGELAAPVVATSQPFLGNDTAKAAATAFGSVGATLSSPAITSLGSTASIRSNIAPATVAQLQIPPPNIQPVASSSAIQPDINVAHTSIPITAPLALASEATEFISMPSVRDANANASSSKLAAIDSITQADGGEDSDGPLPELDSGSDDDMLDDDEDEEE